MWVFNFGLQWWARVASGLTPNQVLPGSGHPKFGELAPSQYDLSTWASGNSIGRWAGVGVLVYLDRVIPHATIRNKSGTPYHNYAPSVSAQHIRYPGRSIFLNQFSINQEWKNRHCFLEQRQNNDKIFAETNQDLQRCLLYSGVSYKYLLFAYCIHS